MCRHPFHANHWHCLWKIPPIIVVKSNITTFILRFVVNMFYCSRVAFTIFKHADIKGVKLASRAQRPLTMGIVRQQFPSLRGTTWYTNGRSTWNGSPFEHIFDFYIEITTIHGVKLKMSSITVIKTNLSGFVVPMHSGLCKQYVKSLGRSASGFNFLFCTHPHALGTTTPFRTGLNPLTLALIEDMSCNFERHGGNEKI